MGNRIVWLLAAAIGCGACSSDTGPAMAAAAFESFQGALQRGDEAACRGLVTAESGKALGAIDWRAVGSRKPLQVLGSERGAGDFRVKVADPNDGGRAAEFVVVREYGRYVVDLVATAGMHTEVVEAAGSREEFVPQELTPRDLERIRQYELSRPVDATTRR
ncbi:MAG: hypothetical protein KDC48_00570 [Planctomycetes bacterium]|nr:hypothetical protein [Planctomycetota bacterium]